MLHYGSKLYLISYMYFFMKFVNERQGNVTNKVAITPKTASFPPQSHSWCSAIRTIFSQQPTHTKPNNEPKGLHPPLVNYIKGPRRDFSGMSRCSKPQKAAVASSRHSSCHETRGPAFAHSFLFLSLLSAICRRHGVLPCRRAKTRKRVRMDVNGVN